MQTQEDFIKNQARCISHEIRNQISICDVYCEIIRKYLQKNNINIPSVDNALKCIQKSTQIVNNSLLDLKALNCYDFKEISLNEILFQAIELSKVYVHDKCIEISYSPSADYTINIDENKFLACLINLIKNAIEAIETSGIINISTEIYKNFASIKILNTGSEIPEELRQNIFEQGMTTKSYGSGLGLFICQNNLKSMGAELKLLKSNKKETVFEIKIPLNIN